MKGARPTSLNFLSVVLFLLFVAGMSISPNQVQGQVVGNNAVYNSGSTTTGSSTWIDASAISSGDVCAAVNAVFLSTANPYPTMGAVIDARGVKPGTTQTCSMNPWSGTTDPPSTILLPSGTIVINSTLTLPNKTKLIGQGGGSFSATGSTGVTTIQAGASFPGATMISMGNSTLCGIGCTAIGIENLWLDGQGQAINGITNNLGQELSYVKRVTFYQLTGTGLALSNTGAVNSGPYSDLAFGLGSYSASASSTTACVQIKNINTRGLHGMTCIGNTGSSGTIPAAGIFLDASNNSIEDLKVEGFGDGIRIGSNANAQGDVLFNIAGGPKVTNVISITNATGKAVSDLSIVGVTNGGSGGATNTIADSRTSTTLTDSTVGIYALGKVMTSGSGTIIGESRFTTSPNTTTWGSGAAAPLGSCKVGSLFSNTSGGAGSTWWYCGSGSTWSIIE